jgi:hypothetical protein
MMNKLTFLPSIDKYIDSRANFYTDEELDLIAIMEGEWRDSQTRFTFHQLIEIFPEAIPAARRQLKIDLKEARVRLAAISDMQEEHYNEVISKAHFKLQSAMKKEADEYYDALRKNHESTIKSITFRLSHLDEITGKKEAKVFNGVSETDIERAKQVPISSLYDGALRGHGKLATGRCPFHNERTASFTVYADQNTWWCFGCNEGGSVVDFVMRLKGIDFLSAVKSLI